MCGGPDGFARNAARMREDLEAVAAGNSDERDAGGFRRSDRERGRRRYGDERRHADRGRLLHHLDGHAAREQHDAGAPGNMIARQCAGELVERVVAAHVFS